MDPLYKFFFWMLVIGMLFNSITNLIEHDIKHNMSKRCAAIGGVHVMRDSPEWFGGGEHFCLSRSILSAVPPK